MAGPSAPPWMRAAREVGSISTTRSEAGEVEGHRAVGVALHAADDRRPAAVGDDGRAGGGAPVEHGGDVGLRPREGDDVGRVGELAPERPDDVPVGPAVGVTGPLVGRGVADAAPMPAEARCGDCAARAPRGGRASLRSGVTPKNPASSAPSPSSRSPLRADCSRPQPHQDRRGRRVAVRRGRHRGRCQERPRAAPRPSWPRSSRCSAWRMARSDSTSARRASSAAKRSASTGVAAKCGGSGRRGGSGPGRAVLLGPVGAGVGRRWRGRRAGGADPGTGSGRGGVGSVERARRGAGRSGLPSGPVAARGGRPAAPPAPPALRGASSTSAREVKSCIRSVRVRSSPTVCGPRRASTASSATSPRLSPRASSRMWRCLGTRAPGVWMTRARPRCRKPVSVTRTVLVS